MVFIATQSGHWHWGRINIEGNNKEQALLYLNSLPLLPWIILVIYTSCFYQLQEPFGITKSLNRTYKHTFSTWRCPWCNGYRRKKWTWQHAFKSWTRLIAFHIALIPLGKVWIQLFSLQLWVNSRTDWVLQPWWGN